MTYRLFLYSCIPHMVKSLNFNNPHPVFLLAYSLQRRLILSYVACTSIFCCADQWCGVVSLQCILFEFFWFFGPDLGCKVFPLLNPLNPISLWNPMCNICLFLYWDPEIIAQFLLPSSLSSCGFVSQCTVCFPHSISHGFLFS